MVQAAAYSTLAMTVTLALARPRLRPSQLRVTPGIAALLGLTVLMLLRLVTVADLTAAMRVQWRPLVSVAGIMLMTGVVAEVGAFERLAAYLESYARRTSAARAFALVFAASLATPSLLNNDAAVLLLTPLVVALGRRLYPGREDVVEAFAFAVFLAPGVAPLVVSNPMNMIVAEYAGIHFNAYAATMLPISAAGALVTWALLRWRFARVLGTAQAAPRAVVVPPRHAAERGVVALLVIVVGAYPLAAALGLQIWSVTVAGALATFGWARLHAVAPARTLARHVSVDILLFLWGVFLIVAGLRHVGVAGSLASLYHAAPDGSTLQLAIVGGGAAVGSALVDNHPMSILNLLALGHGSDRALYAALVGGDLGPRLLPLGSLAGLLWMELLRRAGVRVTIGRFVRMGTLVLVPTLLVSLALLAIG
ncbi:MAG TPA: ArsB/NhaD family transporter [Polyangia bacterium]|nr:ArsB/NhaD family transporter [Polyangia bacterium]